MWSLFLIIVGVQLCLGLPQELQQQQRKQQQQQQEEVDVLKAARVNCKVTATVTYPLETEEDASPTVKCDTNCVFTTHKKDRTYFIGYVYRHFDRLEKEFGLMVEIRYQKGRSKGCNLVPIASNEEVFHEFVPINHDIEATNQSTIIPPTVMPTKLPIKNDEEPITQDPTKEPTSDNIKKDPTSMEPSKVPQPTATLVEDFESTAPDPTTLVDNGHDWVLIGSAHFHISKVRGNWGEGQHYCADIGATLASVRSQEEQDGLAELVGANAWIGLHDMQKEGKHAWVDQIALNYTNWVPGQPDDSQVWWFEWWEGEDCVEMSEKDNFLWNDEDCDKQNIYICRREAESLEGSIPDESKNEITTPDENNNEIN